MIEKYITILAFIMVSKGILTSLYVFIAKRTRLATKGRKFILTKWFGQNDINSQKIFWLSVLWLTIKYWSLLWA